MKTTRRFDKEEVVLRDEPFLVIGGTKDEHLTIFRAFEHTRATSPETITGFFRFAGPEKMVEGYEADAQTVLRIAQGKDKKTADESLSALEARRVSMLAQIIAVWASNCIAINPEGASAIFANFSKLAHSCQPNCYVSKADDSCALTVKALLPLKAGAIVTIDYGSPVTGEFYAAERNVARRRYQIENERCFVCMCPRCDIELKLDRGVGANKLFSTANMLE